MKIISDGAGVPANLETAHVRAAGELGYVAVFQWDYAAAEGYLPNSNGLTPQYKKQKERANLQARRNVQDAITRPV